MNIIERIKYEFKILKLNKPVETMTVEELQLEFVERLRTVKKTKIIDERTNEIIESYLKINSLSKVNKYSSLVKTMDYLGDFNLRKDVLKRYSKYVEEENIEDLIKSLFRMEHHEVEYSRFNKIKEMAEKIKLKFSRKDVIEQLLSKKISPKKEKNLNEAQKRIQEYEKIIYLENIDKIDAMKIASNKEYLFETFYNQLNYNQRTEFLLDYVNNIYSIQTKGDEHGEKIKKLINELPKDLLKEKLISQSSWSLLSKIVENIEITADDLKQYWRKYGKINTLSEYENLLYEDKKIYTAKELKEEFKYFKDAESVRICLSPYIVNMDKEEINKLIFDETIDKDIKIVILDKGMHHHNRKEKMQIFDSIDDEIKDKCSYAFISDAIYKQNEEIGKKEYIEYILSKINKRETYEKYLLDCIGVDNIDMEPIAQLLATTNNKKIFETIPPVVISRFSDEQIKLIYKNAPDNFQADIVNITRRKRYMQDFWDENADKETEEQKRKKIEEYNKNTPEYILYNKENYYDIIMQSSGKAVVELLENTEYAETLNNEQKINILDRIGKYSFIESLVEKYISFEVDLENSKEGFKNLILQILKIKDKELQPIVMEKAQSDYNIINNDKLVSLDEQYDIIKNLIYDKEVSVDNKYVILSYCMRQVYNNDELADEKNEMFKYVNKIANKEKYNEFLKTSMWKYSDMVKYFSNDKAYKLFEKIYDSNNNVIETLTPSFFNEEVIEKMDYNLIEFYSRYRLYSSYENVFTDENKFKIFTEVYDKIKELKAYPEEDLLDVIDFLSRNKIEGDKLGENYIEKIISISKEDSLKNIWEDMYADLDVKQYDDFLKEKTRETVNASYSSRKQLLDAVGKRFLNISYEKMKQYVEIYGRDIDIYIKQYEGKENLTIEEKNELSSLKTIRNLREIFNIKDKNAIRETFNILDEDKEFENIDYTSSIVLDENIKRVFTKDYIKDVYKPKETDKRIIDGTEVYSPKEFNMFVHVIGAYSDFSLDNKEKKATEIWESNENKQSHLMCTSYIRNSNLSFVKQNRNKAVILGFSNIGKNSIQMAAPYDIASETRDIESQKAYRNYEFRTADNLSNSTRNNYNEVDIERRIEGNTTQNIKPNYVICFDTISEVSKKVAKDFGIPIIYINNEEIAKHESEKLTEMFEEYNETQDVKLLNDIIVQYFNNITSFHKNNQDLINKYFNEEVMNKKVNNIIEKLIKEAEGEDKIHALNGLNTIKETIENEIKNFQLTFNDPTLVLKNKFQVKQIRFDIENKINEILSRNLSFAESIKVDKSILSKNNESIEDYMMKKIKESSVEHDK